MNPESQQNEVAVMSSNKIGQYLFLRKKTTTLFQDTDYLTDQRENKCTFKTKVFPMHR